MKTILIVDDDVYIGDMLEELLAKENYSTVRAYSGTEALLYLSSHRPDLILLDLMLPGLSGEELLPLIRNIPVIVLSAKAAVNDKVELLLGGASDYITKPFSVAEVLARIKANIRRRNQYDNAAVDTPQILISGKLVMNLSDYTLTKNGNRVELTSKEFEILKLLMQNPKKVYTKEQIYSLVWNDAYLGDENAVNVHISRLRNKIEEDTRNPRYIITVWGIGYKLGENL